LKRIFALFCLFWFVGIRLINQPKKEKKTNKRRDDRVVCAVLSSGNFVLPKGVDEYESVTAGRMILRGHPPFEQQQAAHTLLSQCLSGCHYKDEERESDLGCRTDCLC
jgi:hypothetical protein